MDNMMERYELEEKQIQGSQEIGNKHQQALAQANRTTKDYDKKLKAKLSNARRVVNLQHQT